MVKCPLRDRDHFLDDGHSDATPLYSLARKESSLRPPPDFLLFMGRWHPTSIPSCLRSWTRSDRACRNAVHVLAGWLGSADAYGVASSMNRLSEERGGKARSHDI